MSLEFTPEPPNAPIDLHNEECVWSMKNDSGIHSVIHPEASCAVKVRE